MKSILMIVICCNADHNSFVTFNQFPPFEKKTRERSLCAGTTWTALWDHIRTFSSQGLATPVRPLETREVILIWRCVCHYCTICNLLYYSLFVEKKQIERASFLALANASSQWYLGALSASSQTNKKSIHVHLLSKEQEPFYCLTTFFSLSHCSWAQILNNQE